MRDWFMQVLKQAVFDSFVQAGHKVQVLKQFVAEQNFGLMQEVCRLVWDWLWADLVWTNYADQCLDKSLYGG
ncbi:hypothetical protein RYX36_036689 [Vicia faba]